MFSLIIKLLLKPVETERKKYYMFCRPTDPLRCLASTPEDILGCGGGLLHGGVDSHLHLPVQKCIWSVHTDHGHVRRGVSSCVSAHISCHDAHVTQNNNILEINFYRWY